MSGPDWMDAREAGYASGHADGFREGYAQARRDLESLAAVPVDPERRKRWLGSAAAALAAGTAVQEDDAT